MHVKDFKGSKIEEFLGETNLLSTMSKLPPFVSHIVLEFYVNLLKDIREPSSLNFQKATVWAYRFEFSPSIINQYWECDDVPDDEIEVSDIDLMVSVIIRRKVRTWS